MSKKLSSPLMQKNGEKYLFTFVISFIIFAVMVIPLLIYTKGYLIYYGDYNSQQIPFYMHAHDVIRSGEFMWDWGTDLGTNFLGSYSFYLFGSPFFWLTIPFPREIVPFLMAPLLCLKYALASTTAYAYIRKFVRNKNLAVVGGLLYAFSGFQAYNIFFNHFHDVTAFFPLLLLAVEERINNNRRGVFALTVALMSIINYFFFTGQVVFVILYFICRCFSDDFEITVKKFFGLAVEAVIGVGIACFILLPSALTVMGNYRVNERLYGLDLVAYNDKTRIWRIIQSFFMIPDVPARTNLFSSENAKWASIGGYLPLFSMAGVLSFARGRKKHWATKLVAICAVCAFVPVLNSSFYMFNASYYARWFYMPVLIMAMMTAQTLDNRELDFDFGIKICSAFMLLMGFFAILQRKVEQTFSDGSKEDVIEWFNLPNDVPYFWGVLLISMTGIILLAYLNLCRKRGKPFIKKSLVLTIASCFICTSCVFYYGVAIDGGQKFYIEHGIKGSENISLPVSDTFYRIDTSKNYDNFPMMWNYSTMRTFHSVVPASIMEFYPEVGVQRDVASRADTDHYTLRSLFSVKYYFDKSNENVTSHNSIMTGFKYLYTQNGFDIYENQLYIPLGFGYNQYVSESDLEERSDSDKEKLLISAIVLSDEQIEKYSSILTPFDLSESSGTSEMQYSLACTERRKNASSKFEYSGSGFASEITLTSDQLVFFSVPYEDGWTATVNGQPAEIEKVSYGFMAVKADAGDNVIKFSYETPGLKTGFIISLGSLLLLGIYMLITQIMRKKIAVSYDYYDDMKHNETFPKSKSYDYDSENTSMAQNYYENRVACEVRNMDNGLNFDPPTRQETIVNEESGIDIGINTDKFLKNSDDTDKPNE